MTATLTLSMEVELGWGDHDTGALGARSPDGSTERAYLSRLLAVADEAGVPVSFDVVGHLFLASCRGSHPGPHHPGWFRADPGTDAGRDGLFYAPDAVDAIAGAETDHEICTHTFSHALFNEISREVAHWELERAQELHVDRFGSPASSLVPPRHHDPPRDVLADHGIEVLRPPMRRRPARTRLHRFRELLAGPIPPSSLRRRGGLVETTCTTYPSLTAPSFGPGRDDAHPAFRGLPRRLRRAAHRRKLRRYTRDVLDTDGHGHLWCHLFDISNETQFDLLAEYLRWLGPFAREHDLAVVPMEALPEHV